MSYFIHDYEIKENDVVLEVGSGQNPFERTDVCLDLHGPDKPIGGRKGWEKLGRWFSKIDHRPFIVGDGQDLPFKNKALDFVFCRHVLEHVEDPVKMCDELCRVGKAGYVSLPSCYLEILIGFSYHRWVCYYIGDELIFTSNRYFLKQERFTTKDGKWLHVLKEKDPLVFELTTIKNPDIWEISFVWKDSLKSRITTDWTGQCIGLDLDTRIRQLEEHGISISDKKWVKRVAILAAKVAEKYGGDQDVVVTAALLLNELDLEKVRNILEKIQFRDGLRIDLICGIVHYFNKRESPFHEVKVVKDAARFLRLPPLDQFELGCPRDLEVFAGKVKEVI